MGRPYSFSIIRPRLDQVFSSEAETPFGFSRIHARADGTDVFLQRFDFDPLVVANLDAIGRQTLGGPFGAPRISPTGNGTGRRPEGTDGTRPGCPPAVLSPKRVRTRSPRPNETVPQTGPGEFFKLSLFFLGRDLGNLSLHSAKRALTQLYR